MKTIVFLLQLAAGLADFAAADKEPLADSQLRARAYEVRQFEERFLDTLNWQHPNSTVKLVGYKMIALTEGQLSDLEHHIERRPDEWAAFTAARYDTHERVLRVYFPVEGALVYHDGRLVEATHMGELPDHREIRGDCRVVGRYRTEQVHGVRGNRVEDGIVYLAEPAERVRTHGEAGNIYVYDFGWREGPHAHEPAGPRLARRDEGGDDGEEEGGSCKQNHGGRVCSLVYGINHGRCPRDYRDCIDYNGWPRKNCGDHSDKTAFIGSDCFTSVARGHCWNEIP